MLKVGFCFKLGDFYHIAAIEARRKAPAVLPPLSPKSETDSTVLNSKDLGIAHVFSSNCAANHDFGPSSDTWYLRQEFVRLNS
jgi:hypothetical protein